MCVPAITLLFLLAEQPVSADSTASRQIAAPCQLVEERTIQYLEDHDFFAGRKHVLGKPVDDFVIDLGNRKNASIPSAKPLSLNRFSIHKYTLPRRLSPLKAYADFRLNGKLRLTETTAESCDATLNFEISAYEWVWSLAAIDDGYRSKFISNGTLERLYLDAIADVFTKTKR